MVGRPLNFRVRARAGLVGEDRRERLAERPVEAGIVGDDQIGGIDDVAQSFHVDELARDHLVGNSRELCDIGRYRNGRLL